MTYQEITIELILKVQNYHKQNLHLSASSIRDELNLNLTPEIVVKIIEGQFNSLVEAK